ncbi:MAG: DEAD/DEAH box helicase [Actinomycetota bacterium]
MPTTPRAGGRSRPGNRRRPQAPAARRPKPVAPVERTPQYEVAPERPLAATFSELGVPAPVVAALARAGCHAPLPIQSSAIPTALAGRDVLGRGRTGSGKTVAFAVPTVLKVAASAEARRPGHPRALVLVPTRELAAQVVATIAPLGRAMGLRTAKVHGGVGQAPQVTALRQGADIVVATPGRLEDLIAQRQCSLASVEVTVLDEADHLADLGFLPAVRRLLDQTPATGQRLLFSATLDQAVGSLVGRYLSRPLVHSVDPEVSTPPELEHYAFTVSPSDKSAVVRELASGLERSLLFTRTKHAAKKLARDLTQFGIPAVDLHGNLSQAQRDRNLASFTGGGARVLVATDIAARGIHVDDVALVVHVDPPTEHKAYLHRSGRTARAGARGSVVTVVLPDQVGDVAAMVRQAGIRPAQSRVGPGAPETLALTGPPARLVPAPAPAPAAGPPRSGRPQRGAPAGPPRRRRR